MVVFFFKQKTAYEMRISDWSSDVCSSDLAHGATGINFTYFIQDPFTGLIRHLQCNLVAPNGTNWGHYCDKEMDELLDRKSVVWGKSVSVRVDLGGRRLMKKKTEERNTQYVYIVSTTNDPTQQTNTK